MSLLNQSNQLYEIKLYYKYINIGENKKLVIINDEKAKIMMEDKEKNKDIDVLITKWSTLTWKEQNEASQLSTKISVLNGQREFNYTIYRDAVVKKCLKEWNISDNGKIVPITPSTIDSLPAEIVVELYQKFERMSEYTESDLGN